MLQNIEQKEIHPINGMIMLVVITIGLILSVGLIILGSILLEQNNWKFILIKSTKNLLEQTSKKVKYA